MAISIFNCDFHQVTDDEVIEMLAAALPILKDSYGMPYASNADLPGSVKSYLPEHAQDIFRAAFNHAFESLYGDPRLEEIAHRIAWAAVKRQYEKIGGVWVRRVGTEG